MPGRVFIAADTIQTVLDMGPGAADIFTKTRPDVAPGDEVAVLIPGTPALRLMRWNMILTGRVNARGRPVMETITNARAETLFEKSAFEGVRRGVLPVSGWYEWTGKPRRKTRWRMRPARDAGFLFAAIWDVWTAPGGLELAQMATVTVEPNADVAPYHHRMPAILSASDARTWLDGAEAAASSVLVPAREGTVTVEEAGFA